MNEAEQQLTNEPKINESVLSGSLPHWISWRGSQYASDSIMESQVIIKLEINQDSLLCYVV